MNAADLPPILDADLKAQLAAYDAGHTMGKAGLRFIYVRELAEEQARRDKGAAERAAMPPVRRKRAEVREAIENSDAASRDNLSYIHSVLAICGLPYTKQPLEVREYERRQGRMSLVIEAGKLMSATGKWERQPLPYGSRARLLMLHLCSEAIRQQSPTIEIADSLTAFIRDMGFEVSGGKNGSLTYFKQQVNALAACRLQIGIWGSGGASTIDTKPFSKMDVWLPTEPNQKMLWPSTITFSKDFFDNLTERALPINNHVIRAFAGSARKLDLLFWLSYRLKKLDAPLSISWDALQEQFGDGFSRQRDFRKKFAEEVADVKSVLTKLPLTLSDDGLTIAPASTSVLAIPAKKALKKT
jgi:hypothetical protein